MRQLTEFSSNERTAIVKGDGGSYVVEMYVNLQLVESKVFAEHTLRIVQNFAKSWTQAKE